MFFAKLFHSSRFALKDTHDDNEGFDSAYQFYTQIDIHFRFIGDGTSLTSMGMSRFF